MNKVYSNNGIKKLSTIFKKENPKKILIISGKNSFSAVKNLILSHIDNYNYFIFDQYTSNPKIEDIVKGIELYKKYNPELMLCIGGGTAIDIAKSIRILAVQNSNAKKILLKKESIKNTNLIPLVIMPTTAGTGSEATHFSVIYIKNKKYSLAHKSMLPNYVILDSKLVYKMPKYVKSCSLFDALTQAIESYWSINSNAKSISSSKKSIKLILKYFDDYINKRPKINVINNIIQASHLSGKSINLTKTTAAHALSYAYTKKFGISHGHAVALLLAPTLMITYLKEEKNKKVLEILSFFNCKNIYQFSIKWKLMMKQANLVTEANYFGIKKKDINYICNSVNTERLDNHPVHLNQQDLTRIVKMSINEL